MNNFIDFYPIDTLKVLNITHTLFGDFMRHPLECNKQNFKGALHDAGVDIVDHHNSPKFNVEIPLCYHAHAQ